MIQEMVAHRPLGGLSTGEIEWYDGNASIGWLQPSQFDGECQEGCIADEASS